MISSNRQLIQLLIAVLLMVPVARAEIIAALTTSAELLIFDSNAPGVIISRAPITGLQIGESLVGIDVRPANGDLVGLSNQNRLYIIDPASAAATLKATLSAPLEGMDFGIDFNPVVDRLRVVSDTGQNLRINPDSGAVTVDARLAYAAGEPHVGEAPKIVDVAYANNVAGTPTTTLFGLDATLNISVRQGGPDGVPSPNGGELFVTGKFGKQGALPKGFDIAPGGTAYVAARLNFPSGSTAVYVLVTVDLVGGDVSQGFIGDGAILIEDIAVVPSVQFSAAAYAVNKNVGVATITVTRTGPAFGDASVIYAVSNGTAIAGTDYTAVSGTLTFAPTDTAKTFDVPIINTATPNEDLFVNLALSNISGGEALGLKAATLRINRNKPEDLSGPQVIDLGMTGTSRAISGMVVKFDRDMDPVKAASIPSYSLLALGKGVKADVVFVSAVYDPVGRFVTLTASETFAQTTFKTLKVKINGKKDGLTGANGSPLGSKNGKSGKDALFTFDILSGKEVSFKDTDGDKATIIVANGGQLDAIKLKGKRFLFQAWILDPIALQSTLSGSVTKSRKGDGIIVISEIIGLDKKENTPLLTNPAFKVKTATFSPIATGRF